MTSGSKKILVALTNQSVLGETGRPTGWWLPELSHFYWELKKEGYEFDFVSPKGGKAALDPASVDRSDADNDKFLETDDFERTKTTKTPGEVNFEEYDLIYYPGGHGPMWDLAKDEKIADIAKSIYESGGVVAAVCHGPAGLLPIRLSDGSFLISGKRVTSVSNLEEMLVWKHKAMPFMLETALKEHGAKYSKGLPGLSHVEVDGRLLTGQNPRSTTALAKEIAKILSNIKNL